MAGRNTIRWALAGLGLATSVIGLVVLFSQRSAGTNSVAPSAPATREARERAERTASEQHATRGARSSGTGIPSIGLPGRIGLSNKERRQGERDEFYRLRLVSLEMYRLFRQEAGMTEEQEQKVLRVLADAQRNYAYGLVGERGLDSEQWAEYRNHAWSDMRAFDKQVLDSLIPILTEEQMAAFLHNIPSAYGFVSGFPLDGPVAIDVGQGRIVAADAGG